MTPKSIRTKKEDRSATRDYLKKAKDNYSAMLLSLENKNYNAVGTLAVQCAISSADAICVHEKGIRSISQDHGDICELVNFIGLPQAKQKSAILKRIIAKKGAIQYERRNVFESEAYDLVKAATRFFEWVNEQIK
jgi:HEPN domain-containing protein